MYLTLMMSSTTTMSMVVVVMWWRVVMVWRVRWSMSLQLGKDNCSYFILSQWTW